MRLYFMIAVLSTCCLRARASTPLALKCLWSTYKSFKISADRKDVIFPNGQVLPFKNRHPENNKIDRKNLTSIDQMFIAPYTPGFSADVHGKKTFPIPTFHDELRGSRYQKLFLSLYGSHQKAIENNLVWVRWVDGSHVEFSKKYGASLALQKVVKGLSRLLETHPEFRPYLRQPLGGAYEWRRIADQNNLSMHAFGVAIDINTKYSDYWLWDAGPDHIPHYRNRIPPEIVEVFERNGFIWGGKWYHYDTMHFEFRPELILSHATCEKEFEKYRD